MLFFPVDDGLGLGVDGSRGEVDERVAVALLLALLLEEVVDARVLALLLLAPPMLLGTRRDGGPVEVRGR
jgi:hypothetical protein